jgi:hypothetical protein
VVQETGTDNQRKPFTRAEAEKIRDALAAPQETLVCPACGGELSLGPPADGASSTAYWEIHCKNCGRGQILQELL